MHHDTAAAAGRQLPVTLDLNPGDGTRFFERWQHHRDVPVPQGLLHYVMQIAPAWAARLGPALLQAHPPNSAWHALAKQLALQCPLLDTRVQRVLLDGGRVSLTLCVGTACDALAELRLQADEVFLDAAWTWDRWQCKALARLCRPGARILAGHVSPSGAHSDAPTAPPPPMTWPFGSGWQETGFVLATESDRAQGVPAAAGQASAVPELRFQPRWQIKRRQPAAWTRGAGRAAVVGAGLAGASVARALALRGWEVVVLERGPAAASGASGLPVGLVVPHVSADDSPRSQLSRSGVRLMLNHARHLLQEAQAWAQSGVEERVLEGQPPDASIAGRWHGEAGWVQPASLVQAWLNHPGIALVCNATVGAMNRSTAADGSPAWELLAPGGAPLPGEHSPFQLVVLCHALQDKALALAASAQTLPDAADQIAACTQVFGTLSFGPHPPAEPGAPPRAAGSHPDAAVFPPHPVNGHGSFVSGVPSDDGPHWYCGSTFEMDPAALADLASQHRSNFQKLRTLLPAVAQTVEATVRPNADGISALRHWQSSRCVSQDRMPLVGPLTGPIPGPSSELKSGSTPHQAPPDVWISAAMGARGLSFSAQCAEMLVAELHGEPWPVPVSLARQVRADRPRRKTGANLPVD